MGTRWRGLLAPIDKPTGDGRRFQAGGVTYRQPPFGLKWQRVDEAGHDTSVIVGSTDTVNIGTVKEAVANDWISAEEIAKTNLAPGDLGAWGAGEMFDDQPTLPRLSEDVAESMMLVGKGVLGPSVDAGAAEAIIVEKGSDEPLTEERLNELWMEAEQSGTEPELEMLFTKYEIAAATLVGIPAFAETSRPFELVAADAPVEAALVASLTAAAAVYPAIVFENPNLTEVTPITVTDDGFVFGHVAQWGVCHVGIPQCTTAPHSGTDYALFHRYPVDTDGGLTSVGRLTTGHGRVGTGCTDPGCRRNDDHACRNMSLTDTIEHYDRLKELALIRVGEDDHGIWMAGVLAGPLDDADRRVLNRRMSSGHWSPVGAGYEMVEVLALAKETPGFPLRVSLRDGRQTAIVAAGGINPDRVASTTGRAPLIDMKALGDYIVGRLANAAAVPPAVLAAAAPVEHTGAMIALVPSSEDAARLAVDGGEPVGELHLTEAYLGEAAEIDEETQQAIIAAMTELASQAGPIVGDGFAINVFNPAADDRDTAIVLGVAGEDLEPFHTQIMDALQPIFAGPDQHAPWVAHVTLVYSDDLSMVEQLADRTNQPVTFDTLRVAFAGVVTDIPLGGDGKPAGGADTAASLLSEIEMSVGNVDPAAIERAAAAGDLLGELEATSV